MALPDVLIDSSFLYALFYQRDPDHTKVKRVLASFSGQFVIPQIVLTEACFLFNRTGGPALTALFIQRLTAALLPFVPVTQEDVARAGVLLQRHATGKLDFVDCCIVAMSERLHIDYVATLDRRDFSILRKSSGAFLTILPE